MTRYEAAGGVATVTLDRPDRLNAWTARMQQEYLGLLDRAESDPDVGVVVVTGAGRGFCAGADSSALDTIAGAGDYDLAAGGAGDGGPGPAAGGAGADHPLSALLAMTKPVIAAINGPAAGIGFVVACFCDLRFAAAGAKLTTSFGRLGLPAEHGISWLLPRLVGAGRAADLLFSSRVVLAEEAATMGLVNRVTPPAELLPETLAYARRMAAEISPASLAVMKRQLWEDQDRDLGASATAAMGHLRRMVAEPDFAEGVAALTAKRPPRFRRTGVDAPPPTA